MIEKVQKSCTKLGMLSDLNYANRLSSLNLPKLDVRRVRGDLIHVFKILRDFFFDHINLVHSPLSHNINTRSVFKINTEFCSHNSRSNFLINCVSKIWNALPSNVKLSKSINEFKNLLDEIGLEHFI
jgi:hypothetical protein